MDTTRFNRLHPKKYKAATRDHWSVNPCGSNYSDREYLSREYFEEIERHRYGTHPWIIDDIRDSDLEGRTVLEVGYGMGTDHLAMAREGGVMHGIDLTPANLQVTRERFRQYGYDSSLIVGDAENLPYPDGAFDFVYSFGVVHHSPDTPRIVSEIHRVLKPGGCCHITVYHKNSLFFWWSVFLVGYLWKAGWRSRSLEQQISLIEYPNDEENMVIRLYRKEEFGNLFRGFRTSKCRVKHLIPVDLSYLSKLYADPHKPTPFLDRLGERFGWYLVVDAEK